MFENFRRCVHLTCFFFSSFSYFYYSTILICASRCCSHTNWSKYKLNIVFSTSCNSKYGHPRVVQLRNIPYLHRFLSRLSYLERMLSCSIRKNQEERKSWEEGGSSHKNHWRKENGVSESSKLLSSGQEAAVLQSSLIPCIYDYTVSIYFLMWFFQNLILLPEKNKVGRGWNYSLFVSHENVVPCVGNTSLGTCFILDIISVLFKVSSREKLVHSVMSIQVTLNWP